MTTTHRWWVFALVCLALFMGALDSLVVTTALPAIGRALHARLSDLEWTVNAYALVFTIGMIPATAVGDRLGHRRVLLSGVAIFTLGSALAALSSSSLMLALSRALQGVGAVCITPLTLTILTRTFPEKQRGLVSGLWSGMAGPGLTIGPLVGGAVVSGWNWNESVIMGGERPVQESARATAFKLVARSPVARGRLRRGQGLLLHG